MKTIITVAMIASLEVSAATCITFDADLRQFPILVGGFICPRDNYCFQDNDIKGNVLTTHYTYQKTESYIYTMPIEVTRCYYLKTKESMSSTLKKLLDVNRSVEVPINIHDPLEFELINPRF